MYLQQIYAETDTDVLLDFIRQNPLGILTTGIPSTIYPHLQSTHIPWVLDNPTEDGTPKPQLRGHIAKQNPQCKAMVDSLTASAAQPSGSFLEHDVMVLFNGPHHHYVTPKFYTETKPATGKVAPTWNYAAVQVYGKARIYFDSAREETQNFLARQLHDLSQNCERDIMGYAGEGGQEHPWTLSEAPQGYINILKKNIAGLEVSIDRIEGKFKMSQEKGTGDREGVIRGLRSLRTESADYIANSIEERAKAGVNAAKKK